MMEWKLTASHPNGEEIYTADLPNGGSLEVYNVGQYEMGWFWQYRDPDGQVHATHTYPYRLREDAMALAEKAHAPAAA